MLCFASSTDNMQILCYKHRERTKAIPSNPKTSHQAFIMSDKNGSVSADDANDKLTSLYIIIVVSAIFAFVVLMHFICCKACTELDETADENFFLRVLSTDSLTAEQERKFLEKRRKLILKSILQKVRNQLNFSGISSY